MDYDHQDKPSFFAIIKEGFNINSLKVPPEIVTDLGEELWKNTFMILVGSSSEKWEVSILKKGNDIYLQIGWQKFLIDNKVMLEELLVFTYDGENKFQAQTFGKNGLERPCFKNVQEQEEVQEEEEVTAAAPLTVAKRKRGRPRKVPSPESECFKKEKAEVPAKIAVKRNDGRARKSPAGERVCFRKKEEVAATIMSMGKPRKNRQRVSVKKEEAKAAATMAAAINKGRTRENPAGERVCVKKEDAKAEETIVAERKKGRTKKYPAPVVIYVN